MAALRTTHRPLPTRIPREGGGGGAEGAPGTTHCTPRVPAGASMAVVSAPVVRARRPQTDGERGDGGGTPRAWAPPSNAAQRIQHTLTPWNPKACPREPRGSQPPGEGGPQVVPAGRPLPQRHAPRGEVAGRAQGPRRGGGGGVPPILRHPPTGTSRGSKRVLNETPLTVNEPARDQKDVEPARLPGEAEGALLEGSPPVASRRPGRVHGGGLGGDIQNVRVRRPRGARGGGRV